jgi:hypothetical protein
MTVRAPRSTEDQAPGRADAPASPEAHDSFERDKTREGMGFAGVAQATQVVARRPVEQGTPIEVARPERSEPIRVFSMKDQTAPRRRPDEQRAPLHVQLRSLAEVARRNDTPVGLGRLAPPRDPRQARARRLRGNLGWACVALGLAGAISLAIWLAAG